MNDFSGSFNKEVFDRLMKRKKKKSNAFSLKYDKMNYNEYDDIMNPDIFEHEAHEGCLIPPFQPGVEYLNSPQFSRHVSLELQRSERGGKEDKYHVYRLKEGEEEWNSIATTGPGEIRTFYDTNGWGKYLEQNTTYYYRIRASNGNRNTSGGYSLYSPVLKVNTPEDIMLGVKLQTNQYRYEPGDLFWLRVFLHGSPEQYSDVPLVILLTMDETSHDPDDYWFLNIDNQWEKGFPSSAAECPHVNPRNEDPPEIYHVIPPRPWLPDNFQHINMPYSRGKWYLSAAMVNETMDRTYGPLSEWEFEF